MGLDTSHGAFHGAYSAFNRLRQAVARAAGGSYPPHFDDNGEYRKDIDQGFWYVPDDVSPESHPGLYEFLSHSDCDGEISPEMCIKVADDLEKLIPIMERDGYDQGKENAGHLKGAGGIVACVRRFAEGCRLAAQNGEVLDFH
jgi:hypothetical protein